MRKVGLAVRVCVCVVSRPIKSHYVVVRVYTGAGRRRRKGAISSSPAAMLHDDVVVHSRTHIFLHSLIEQLRAMRAWDRNDNGPKVSISLGASFCRHDESTFRCRRRILE